MEWEFGWNENKRLINETDETISFIMILLMLTRIA